LAQGRDKYKFLGWLFG